jgi:hypothetical protein
MGIASPLFTRKMEASVNNIVERVNPPQDASRPTGVPRIAPVVLPLAREHVALATIAAGATQRGAQR